MKRRWIKTMAAALVMTLLSGCADTASSKSGGTAAAAWGDGVSGAGTGGAGAEDAGAGAGTGETGGESGDGTADSGAPGGRGPEGGEGGGQARTEAGKPAATDADAPEVYEAEELFTRQENILSLSDSAAAWGIS